MLAVFIFLFLQPMCTSMMSNQSYEISELNTISDQVIVDFAKKMQKKGLKAAGIGGREDHGKVTAFQVSFQYGKALDIASARRLIVETILLFLEEINNNEPVRKYLINYPAIPSNVIVSILPD